MNHQKKLGFLISVCAGIFFLQGCAAMTSNTYEGYLQSGEIHSGYLHSSDLWLFNGEEGSRVVIADAVKQGEPPLEISIFAPGSTKCEAHADCVSKTCRVFDHELQSTGEYTLVVHRDGPKHDGEYRLSLAKLPKNGCFSIDPNDPDGYLIKIGLHPARGVYREMEDRCSGRYRCGYPLYDGACCCHDPFRTGPDRPYSGFSRQKKNKNDRQLSP